MRLLEKTNLPYLCNVCVGLEIGLEKVMEFTVSWPKSVGWIGIGFASNFMSMMMKQ